MFLTIDLEQALPLSLNVLFSILNLQLINKGIQEWVFVAVRVILRGIVVP